MAKTSAKAVAKSYFEAVAARDSRAMAAHWKEGGIDRLHGLAELRAPQGVIDWFGAMFRAFPDLELEVTDSVAYGDRAAVRWQASGTFTGPGKFEGLAPTGARVVLEGVDMLTIEDGMITANHAYVNAAEMARQLGAMPPAGSIGERAMLGAVNARTATLSAIRGRRG